MKENTPAITYVRNLDGVADTRQTFARAAVQGVARRVWWGAYLQETDWAALERREQYALRVRAIAETRRNRPVLSHASAAVLLGLPLLGLPPSVHISTGTVTSRRSHPGVVKHLARLGHDDVIERDGLLMTSIERTVLDLAATSGLAASVMAVDRALLVDRWNRIAPMTTRDRLLDAWRRAQPLRAHARTLAAIRLGQTRSESPLESVSRVSMYVLGAPRPRLQWLQQDRHGEIGYSDYDWPTFDAVAEADGDYKYLDPGIRGEKSVEQVVLDEKIREDRIRAIPKHFARWRWKAGIDPTQLKPYLVRLGLPLGTRWPLD